MTTHSNLYGGLTLTEYDPYWVTVATGLTERQPHLRYQAGLYRFLDGGQVMALGAAVRLPGANVSTTSGGKAQARRTTAPAA